jgi:hypothetical protein
LPEAKLGETRLQHFGIGYGELEFNLGCLHAMSIRPENKKDAP